jgi:hypothetical protein
MLRWAPLQQRRAFRARTHRIYANANRCESYAQQGAKCGIRVTGKQPFVLEALRKSLNSNGELILVEIKARSCHDFELLLFVFGKAEVLEGYPQFNLNSTLRASIHKKEAA